MTRVLWGLVAVLAVLSATLNAISGGDVVAAMLPSLAVAAVVLLWLLPPGPAFLLVLTTALTLDNPQERPQQYRWQSGLYAAGEALYMNLNKLTGVEALKVSLLEVVLVSLLAILGARLLVDRKHAMPKGAAGALPAALAVMAAGLLFLFVRGAVRGGDMKQALWQARQLGWFPVLGWLALRALSSRRLRTWLMVLTVGISVVRAMEGYYYYVFICRPLNHKPEYVTTHADSVLFVLTIILLVVAVMEKPRWSTIVPALVVGPIILFAMVINDRRLAFVELAACGVAFMLLSRKNVYLPLMRVIVASIPLLVGYVAVGWNSNARIFAPVAMLKSASDKDDASNQTRDIENYNLVVTLQTQPLFGQGFGHEYVERIHAFNIEHLFAQYRFIGHNSVLWIWSVAGAAGFSLLWAPLIVGIFMASRAYRRAVHARDRMVTMAAVCAALVYMLQAYGDMGMQSWMATMVVTAFLGAASRACVDVGAWTQDPVEQQEGRFGVPASWPDPTAALA